MKIGWGREMGLGTEMVGREDGLHEGEGWCTVAYMIHRDQLNSRFHGRDIFHEIGLLPWKMRISVKSWCFVNFNTFTFIFEGFQSFISSYCADFGNLAIILTLTCHVGNLGWSLMIQQVWMAQYVCCELVIHKMVPLFEPERTYGTKYTNWWRKFSILPSFMFIVIFFTFFLLSFKIKIVILFLLLVGRAFKNV